MSMFELVLLVLAYTGVGTAVLVVGFYALDLLTPGNLGRCVVEGNRNAAFLAASALVSLGLIVGFAIFFTGSEWDSLVDAGVFGLVGVAAQTVGFIILDAITPGKLGELTVGRAAVAHQEVALRPATVTAMAFHFAVALIICSSLT